MRALACTGMSSCYRGLAAGTGRVGTFCFFPWGPARQNDRASIALARRLSPADRAGVGEGHASHTSHRWPKRVSMQGNPVELGRVIEFAESQLG